MMIGYIVMMLKQEGSLNGITVDLTSKEDDVLGMLPVYNNYGLCFVCNTDSSTSDITKNKGSDPAGSEQ